jgi:hypothetical protein
MTSVSGVEENVSGGSIISISISCHMKVYRRVKQNFACRGLYLECPLDDPNPYIKRVGVFAPGCSCLKPNFQLWALPSVWEIGVNWIHQASRKRSIDHSEARANLFAPWSVETYWVLMSMGFDKNMSTIIFQRKFRGLLGFRRQQSHEISGKVWVLGKRSL